MGVGLGAAGSGMVHGLVCGGGEGEGGRPPHEGILAGKTWSAANADEAIIHFGGRWEKRGGHLGVWRVEAASGVSEVVHGLG